MPVDYPWAAARRRTAPAAFRSHGLRASDTLPSRARAGRWCAKPEHAAAAGEQLVGTGGDHRPAGPPLAHPRPARRGRLRRPGAVVPAGARVRLERDAARRPAGRWRRLDRGERIAGHRAAHRPAARGRSPLDGRPRRPRPHARRGARAHDGVRERRRRARHRRTRRQPAAGAADRFGLRQRLPRVRARGREPPRRRRHRDARVRARVDPRHPRRRARRDRPPHRRAARGARPGRPRRRARRPARDSRRPRSRATSRATSRSERASRC